MSKSYSPDPREAFCKVRLVPSGVVISLPVQTFKKPVQGSCYKSREFVEYAGEKYLLPEWWAHLCHVYEITAHPP